MHVLVAYDITDNKVRNKVFSFLREKGLNTQKSVFECEMDKSLFDTVCRFLESVIDKDHDSILFYSLCHRCSNSIFVIGQGINIVQQDWLVL